MDVSFMTDEELVNLVITEGGTAREVELMQRLARALDIIEGDDVDAELVENPLHYGTPV